MTDQGESRSLPRKGGVGRGLRRALWGGGVAVAATTVMIAVTLPRDAAGDDHSTTGGPAAASGAPGQQDAGSGGVIEDDAPQGGQQTGRGPLTKAEVDRAKSIALQRDALRSAEDVDGERGPEYLDTDLAEPADATEASADGARRVEVLFYDYGHDRLVKKTVNLTAGTVEHTDTATGMQPPPSNDETWRPRNCSSGTPSATASAPTSRPPPRAGSSPRPTSCGCAASRSTPPSSPPRPVWPSVVNTGAYGCSRR